ncbi:MAG: zinc ribbon domain-containing protein, partial [Acidobacteria bacterium]|nr:zinc ribbon domain-containing protein [Acidobacteriota bacterium]
VLEVKKCEHCGADVRTGSLYCYSCGKSIEKSVANIDRGIEKTVEPIIPETNGDLPNAKVEENDSKIAALSRPQLRTAKSLRNRASPVPRQFIESIWVATETTPIFFYAASILVFVLAIILFILALYLR